MAIVSSAEAGLRAAPGATVLQLRAPDLTTALLEREAVRLVTGSVIRVVISSRIDVALACGAAGVNLPQRDVGVADARRLLGDSRLVGRSVHSIEAALDAQRDGADYVIFGPVWASASHPDRAPAGLEALSRVAQAVGIPVLAVGGVTANRIADVLASGASGYAAIRLFE